jgi:sarcosine oxidase, subunit beta
MNKTYEVIIIGAGSVGVPIALELARLHLPVLVLDSRPSSGQGENKKADGGIRATHSDLARISVCQRSIEIFSTWKETYGLDIHWRSHGYSFPAYSQEHEEGLKALLKVQKRFGLNIDWISADEYRQLNPHIQMTDLRGSTYSPQDGSASPLLYIESCHAQAVALGVQFRFKETVTGFETAGHRLTAVVTDQGRYEGALIVNASGSLARQIARMAGSEASVAPECHEAAVSEPVKPFMGPMVVDIRRRPGSANFYFHQAASGQVVFCLTSDPPTFGIDLRSTSRFLPLASRRMIETMPCLANLKVRRTWRGMFPMTPDGLPIVGHMKERENFFQAVGMGGQGFMLGPGLAELVARILTDRTTEHDLKVLSHFDPYRDFKVNEKLY